MSDTFSQSIKEYWNGFTSVFQEVWMQNASAKSFGKATAMICIAILMYAIVMGIGIGFCYYAI